VTERIGRYEIVEEIGQGEVSTVYRARAEADVADVAVKVLHPHLARDPVIRARFAREAEIARGLSHPNILRIYELLGGDDGPAAVMEYCPGGSLAGSPPLSQEALLSVARQVALALAAAHAKGIVHRDVKPANLLVDASGGIKLCDFGSARVANMVGLTRSTMFAGGSEYAPPESLFSPFADPRWDLYSLGAALYRLATGKPHGRATLAELAELAGAWSSAQGSGASAAWPAREPIEALNPGIEPWLAQIVVSLLAPLDERPRSAAELLSALDEGSGRGGAPKSRASSKACLFCGATMSFDAPVCLSCGEEDIIFESYEAWDAQTLIVKKVPESARVLERFFRSLRAIACDPSLRFDFITEDRRLYSKEERGERIDLPARLIDGLRPEVADRLIALLAVVEGGQSVTLSRVLSTKKFRVSSGGSAQGKSSPLVKPRRCSAPRPDVLASYRAAASKALALDEVQDRGLFATVLGSASRRGEGEAAAVAELSAELYRILSEAAAIRSGLESVSLGESYAAIRDLDRAIEETGDAYEAGELMNKRREIEDVIERYHAQEDAYSLLVQRAASLHGASHSAP
jgi:serine/threonine protein kinase